MNFVQIHTTIILLVILLSVLAINYENRIISQKMNKLTQEVIYMNSVLILKGELPMEMCYE